MYKLRNALEEDKDLLIKYKLLTIYEFADNLDEEEMKRIEEYVKESVSSMLYMYDVILVDNKIGGSFLVTEYEDGVMLDEIFLEEEYRCKGIGSSLIKDLLSKHGVVYLWVYKDNVRAIRLYESNGFKIVDETKTRYFMRYVKE